MSELALLFLVLLVLLRIVRELVSLLRSKTLSLTFGRGRVLLSSDLCASQRLFGRGF
jgi:hypothetical protein